MDAERAQRAFELENAVTLVDPTRDALYTYDAAEQRAINEEHPWRGDPHYFKNVRISAVALLKMVMHARSGGSIEVMGLMQGKIQGDTFIVMDAFRLPVEGTETRVNAGAQADEYQVNYLQACRENNRLENAIGWYHSHPGYGCWLSGIDVSTQHLQQSYQDPYLAVVIDPDRTISAGKVDIGAFRTFPEDYKPTDQNADDDEYQAIPLAKMEDFGAHASRYYSLEVSHFKSSLDSHLLSMLWKKYWMATLSQSPLFSNREFVTTQITDLGQKIKNTEKSLIGPTRFAAGGRTGSEYVAEGPLEKAMLESRKVVREQENGLMASEIKAKLFRGLAVNADDQAQQETNVMHDT